MADDAPVTFNTLPDDILHEIFGRVFQDAPKGDEDPTDATGPPRGIHLTLRSVCRRWRGVADWAELANDKIRVYANMLADVDAVLCRHPAAIKHLTITEELWLNASGTGTLHSTRTPSAVASLIGGNPDLRRSISTLTITLCCSPSLLRVVTPVATCSALTELMIGLFKHNRQRSVPADVLAPLSALPLLQQMTLIEYSQAMSVAWPALPDAPRLTQLVLFCSSNFVPVGCDAALGRLWRLGLLQKSATPYGMVTEDPFFLRVALDAVTWQPHRLTALEEIDVELNNTEALLSSLRRPCRAHVGAEWAPLAAHVTRLTVDVHFSLSQEPSTVIVAGLGALTALRSLDIMWPSDENVMDGDDEFSPLAIALVRAPHLTQLHTNWAFTPLNLATFPGLVNVDVASCVPRRAPVSLRSLVARSQLRTLFLGHPTSPPVVNLAELFAGGDVLPALYELRLKNLSLEWNTAGLANTPTVPKFATRARALLPSLAKLDVQEGPRLDLPTEEFNKACRRHVLLLLRPSAGAAVNGASCREAAPT